MFIPVPTANIITITDEQNVQTRILIVREAVAKAVVEYFTITGYAVERLEVPITEEPPPPPSPEEMYRIYELWKGFESYKSGVRH